MRSRSALALGLRRVGCVRFAAASIYRFELTGQYLLDNGISGEQAANESGVHETTIATGFSSAVRSTTLRSTGIGIVLTV